MIARKKRQKQEKFNRWVRYCRIVLTILSSMRTILLLFPVCRTIFSSLHPLPESFSSSLLSEASFSPRERCSICNFSLVSLVKPQFGQSINCCTPYHFNHGQYGTRLAGNIYSFFLSRAAIPVIKCPAKTAC